MARKSIYRGHDGKSWVFGNLMEGEGSSRILIRYPNTEAKIAEVRDESVGQMAGYSEALERYVFEGDVFDVYIDKEVGWSPGIVVYDESLFEFVIEYRLYGETDYVHIWERTTDNLRYIGPEYDNPNWRGREGADDYEHRMAKKEENEQ